MNIAIILAGGSGLRVKNSSIPKQFLEINNKPIILHTFEKFFNNENINEVVIVCHPEWRDYLNQIMNKFLYKTNDFHIVGGGMSRNDSIKNALNYINKNLVVNNEDIILTHDAARMLVSIKTIDENILYTKKYGAVSTVVPTTDTIACSSNGDKIDSILNRNHLFNSQTPQSFKLEIINYIYKNYNDTSDACSLALQKGYYIHLLNGEYSNIKITNDFDFSIIELMCRKNG